MSWHWNGWKRCTLSTVSARSRSVLHLYIKESDVQGAGFETTDRPTYKRQSCFCQKSEILFFLTKVRTLINHQTPLVTVASLSFQDSPTMWLFNIQTIANILVCVVLPGLWCYTSLVIELLYICIEHGHAYKWINLKKRRDALCKSCLPFLKVPFKSFPDCAGFLFQMNLCNFQCR